MRLIDADALVLAVMDASFSSVDEDTIFDLIDSVQLIDAVPVVHGRWIPIEEKLWNLDFPVLVDWKCSACNLMGHEDFRYCPNCGAKMDGERKDE